MSKVFKLFDLDGHPTGAEIIIVEVVGETVKDSLTEFSVVVKDEQYFIKSEQVKSFYAEIIKQFCANEIKEIEGIAVNILKALKSKKLK